MQESEIKMEKKTVAVIFGGYSPEYDVSLKSSYSIIKAIDQEMYELILLGIDRQGKWFRYYGDVENIPCDKWWHNTQLLKSAFISPERGSGLLEVADGRVRTVSLDIVFPVLHGRYGEDGTIQGLCELAGIPVVGSGSAASALCIDKDIAHRLVSLAGIRVPKTVRLDHALSSEELHSSLHGFSFPLIVKPVKSGSSFGISMIDKLEDLVGAVNDAFMFDDAVLLEESIDGFECGCAVVGNNRLITGRIDEIELADGIFTYEEKYSPKTSKIHMPARIDEDTERRLQKTALYVYRLLGCRGYARVDFFLTKNNEIVFSEINTIPGFTAHSRFAKMVGGIDIEYPELVDMLIALSIEAKNNITI